MEIAFQNRREDLEPFYHYMLKETKEGKQVSRLAFFLSAAVPVLASALIGLFEWGIFREWQNALRVTIFFFFVCTFVILVITGFKPFYNPGLEVYRHKGKSMTTKEWQIFQLPRTIVVEDDWLELRSSEAVHQWQWRWVDKIGITPDFIYIHVSKQTVAYVPKRDFPSSSSFIDFGKKLVELMERHKNESIGTE